MNPAPRAPRRIFALTELTLLVEEHAAIKDTLGQVRNGRRPMPLIGDGAPPFISMPDARVLKIATPPRLARYLDVRGWRRDENGSDDFLQSWMHPRGGTCATHHMPVADVEVMAWDVDSIAVGEDATILSILLGLLAIGPLDREAHPRPSVPKRDPHTLPAPGEFAAWASIGLDHDGKEAVEEAVGGAYKTFAAFLAVHAEDIEASSVDAATALRALQDAVEEAKG